MSAAAAGPATVSPVLREARWTDVGALAALEGDLFPHDAWAETTWWAELAGRPRRDYVVIDGAVTCDHICIQKRPGGRMPPLPKEAEDLRRLPPAASGSR